MLCVSYFKYVVTLFIGITKNIYARKSTDWKIIHQFRYCDLWTFGICIFIWSVPGTTKRDFVEKYEILMTKKLYTKFYFEYFYIFLIWNVLWCTFNDNFRKLCNFNKQKKNRNSLLHSFYCSFILFIQRILINI